MNHKHLRINFIDVRKPPDYHPPIAYCSADVGLQRALARNGKRPTPAKLLEIAEHRRPWRAYAMLHLWMDDRTTRPCDMGLRPMLVGR